MEKKFHYLPFLYEIFARDVMVFYSSFSLEFLHVFNALQNPYRENFIFSPLPLYRNDDRLSSYASCTQKTSQRFSHQIHETGKNPSQDLSFYTPSGGGIPLANVPLSIIESHLCLDLEANSTHFMNKHHHYSLIIRENSYETFSLFVTF